MFTECTKTLFCILMRNDSKEPSLFSSSCSELSNIMFLSMALFPMSLNSFPLMCRRKADRNSVSDFKVCTHSSINHTAEKGWLNCLSPNLLQDCRQSHCSRLWRSGWLQYEDTRSVSSPISTHLSKMLLNSRVNPQCFLWSSKISCFSNTPVCPSCSPLRSSPLVASHLRVKLSIANQWRNSNFTWRVPGDRVMDG